MLRAGPGWHHQGADSRQDGGEAGDAVHSEPGCDAGQTHTGEALQWIKGEIEMELIPLGVATA